MDTPGLPPPATPLASLGLVSTPLPAPLPIWFCQVDAEQWSAAAHEIAGTGGRLVSVWAVNRDVHHASSQDAGDAVCAAFATKEGLMWLQLPVAPGSGYPDISGLYPFAARMQRTVFDLSGIHAAGQEDTRAWLDHGVWSEQHPLAGKPVVKESAPGQLPGDYPFVRVTGDGVHEIAVGPVHAGIIEPGHFRFSVVGEKVLRLEEHLGYVHKGIEKRFTNIEPREAHRLAARVSGDSTVAYGWAYCMALESAWGCTIPERAQSLRALMLERERVANHLGDLGALGNDAALAFGLAHFSRLREDWQRLSADAFGHRFMMDVIVPGGVAADPSPSMLERMSTQCDDVAREIRLLRTIYDEHAGLQDRFMTTGCVTPELATRLGLTGMAGRASAMAADLRCDHAWAPYDRLQVKMALQANGDVAARVAVRFDEALESLRLIQALCAELAATNAGTFANGPLCAELKASAQPCMGAGWVEGWRGEILVALELSAQAGIVRCHCHDPSWQNWPVLEHAVIGNIVPDFPLINKSFNLSYSGHDL